MRFIIAFLSLLALNAIWPEFSVAVQPSINGQRLAYSPPTNPLVIDEDNLPHCSQQRHLYGTISEVHGSKLVINSNGSAGRVYLLTERASFWPKNISAREGLALRAHGCFVENTGKNAVFQATYVTLARSWRDIQFIPDRANTAQTHETRAPSQPRVVAAKTHASPAVHSVVTNSQKEEDTQSCGGYRWATKIGADGDASAVDLSVKDTTISSLRQFAVPNALSESGRAKPAETTVYRLRNVTVVDIALAHDRDYHLTVRDSAGGTMRLESPDPACAASSAFLNQIAAVRNYIKSNQISSGTLISVTGVGFFDPAGSGGLELHPLLSICVGKDCAPTAISWPSSPPRIAKTE